MKNKLYCLVIDLVFRLFCCQSFAAIGIFVFFSRFAILANASNKMQLELLATWQKDLHRRRHTKLNDLEALMPRFTGIKKNPGGALPLVPAMEFKTRLFVAKHSSFPERTAFSSALAILRCEVAVECSLVAITSKLSAWHKARFDSYGKIVRTGATPILFHQLILWLVTPASLLELTLGDFEESYYKYVGLYGHKTARTFADKQVRQHIKDTLVQIGSTITGLKVAWHIYQRIRHKL